MLFNRNCARDSSSNEASGLEEEVRVGTVEAAMVVVVVTLGAGMIGAEIVRQW